MKLDGKGVFNEALLLVKVNSFRADGRAGTAFPTGVADGVIADLLEATRDVGPRTHVARFFLAPDEFFLSPWIARHDGLEHFPVQGIELLDANDGCVLDALFFAILEEIVVDFARAEDETSDLFGSDREFVIVENFLKGSAFCHVFKLGLAKRMAQEALGRHDDERFANAALHLTPEGVEVLRWGGEVADLPVAFGAELEEALEAGAGVLGALAFVTVRQEDDEVAGLHPFAFGAGDELVDDDLCAVNEVAELGFPADEHVGR